MAPKSRICQPRQSGGGVLSVSPIGLFRPLAYFPAIRFFDLNMSRPDHGEFRCNRQLFLSTQLDPGPTALNQTLSQSKCSTKARLDLHVPLSCSSHGPTFTSCFGRFSPPPPPLRLERDEPVVFRLGGSRRSLGEANFCCRFGIPKLKCCRLGIYQGREVRLA